jgi:hypothetical protein
VLGLFIARKIIERHGGHIEMQNTPGVGSTFHVILPMHVDLAEKAEEVVVPASHTQAVWTMIYYIEALVVVGIRAGQCLDPTRSS